MIRPFIDIGVNLMHRSFHADREEVVRRAAEAGVAPLIVTGTVRQHKYRGRPANVRSSPGSRLTPRTKRSPVEGASFFAKKEIAITELSSVKAAITGIDPDLAERISAMTSFRGQKGPPSAE
ncbi:MAG: hydrolase tatd family [Paenibacillus sp.]|nr:hydrolase tatd family [Paenibacillus sp.]